MLLFRSEDDIDGWCDDRLDPNWHRRTIAERQGILDAVGLVGLFWRLTPDHGQSR